MTPITSHDSSLASGVSPSAKPTDRSDVQPEGKSWTPSWNRELTNEEIYAAATIGIKRRREAKRLEVSTVTAIRRYLRENGKDIGPTAEMVLREVDA